MQGQAKLVLDLDAICNFIFAEEGRQVDTTIKEATDPNGKVMKTIEEVKSSDHSQHEAIRYDLVKKLLDASIDIGLDEQTGAPLFESVNDVACYNTLFQYGFYKSVEV